MAAAFNHVAPSRRPPVVGMTYIKMNDQPRPMAVGGMLKIRSGPHRRSSVSRDGMKLVIQCTPGTPSFVSSPASLSRLPDETGKPGVRQANLRSLEYSGRNFPT